MSSRFHVPSGLRTAGVAVPAAIAVLTDVKLSKLASECFAGLIDGGMVTQRPPDSVAAANVGAVLSILAWRCRRLDDFFAKLFSGIAAAPSISACRFLLANAAAVGGRTLSLIG